MSNSTVHTTNPRAPCVPPRSPAHSSVCRSQEPLPLPPSAPPRCLGWPRPLSVLQPVGLPRRRILHPPPPPPLSHSAPPPPSPPQSTMPTHEVCQQPRSCRAQTLSTIMLGLSGTKARHHRRQWPASRGRHVGRRAVPTHHSCPINQATTTDPRQQRRLLLPVRPSPRAGAPRHQISGTTASSRRRRRCHPGVWPATAAT